MGCGREAGLVETRGSGTGLRVVGVAAMSMVRGPGRKGPHNTEVEKDTGLEVAVWIRGQDSMLLASPWPSGALGFLVCRILT